jgi:uncharacterized protein with ParB-like and HNH nuclease domain
MKYSDIPQFTRSGTYQVNIPLEYVKREIDSFINEDDLQLNPDFQRGHVWTKKQQIAFIEFLLRGGKSSKVIYFNCPNWLGNRSRGQYNDFVVVDGLQRLTAVLAFINDEIPAFGIYHKDYEGRVPLGIDLIFNVNNLETKAEVLQWYIEINSGGTPHTNKEIERVKALLEEEKKNNE